MSKEKVCRKCGKKLPPDYKEKYCEACKGDFAHGAKKAGGLILGLGAIAVGIIKAIPRIIKNI